MTSDVPSGDPHPTDAEVVILNQYYIPDVASTGHLLAELARELVRMGRRVSVLTCFPSYGPRETWVDCPAQERLDGVNVRRLRTTRFRKDSTAGRLANSFTFLVPLALKLLFQRAHGRVFMYTSNPPFLGLIGGAISLLRPHPYVVLLHDSYPQIPVLIGKLRKGSPVVHVWHLANRLLYRRAERTIVLCEGAKELIVRTYGVDPSRVHVVHNWADPTALSPVPKSQSAFARANGYDRTFTLLYSGNLGLYYEFDTLLEAARRLSGDPDFRLVFVGSGGKRQYIAERISSMGLTNVDMHQYQPFETLNDSLNACDASLVTIAPGVEGISFPSKLYSSLAVGKPVLALSEAGGELQRIMSESGAGLWSPIGDVDALIANIRRLRDDREASDAMGRRARELMERRYTIRAAAADYAAIFDLAGARAADPSRSSD
jgi:glycosyltransferase involved in cell wall biosynthesis